MKWMFLFLFLLTQICSAQIVSVRLVEKIPLEADRYIGTDNYGNSYFIKKNVLFKKTSETIEQFSDLQLGKLSSVDIVNPLKITLFYQNMNTVVFLDRHLIEINRIRFNRLPQLRTLSFARTASNNTIWMMNVATQSLVVYNYLKKEVVAETQPLTSRIVDQASNFNFCWLLLENALECYNSYGSQVARIAPIDLDAIVEDNGRILGKTKTKFYLLEKKEETFLPIDLPDIEVQQFFLNDQNLYLYDGEFIYNYRLLPS